MSVYQTLTLEQVGQSIANNTSKVRIKWTSQQTGSSYNNAPGDKAYYYITINGGTETEHTVAFTLPQNTTKTILDTTLTVSHKADGTGSIKVRTWMDTEISAGVITQTKTLTLDTIPRASAVSAPKTGTLGTALKITIGRKSTSFSDKLYYKIGGNSAKEITEYDGKTSYSWVPPVDLASNAPNSTQLAVTIITNTYNGSTYVGRSECTVTLSIPTSVVPTLSVAVSDPTGNKTKYTGYFLQLRSKIKVAITGTGIQGSTIKAYSIKVGRTQGTGTIYTANAKTGTTDFLQFAGSAWVTCTVTDSRGRTATKSIEYTVKPYSVPTISTISATRCTQDGTASRTGEYGKVTFTAAITPLSNKNTAAYKVQYREYGTEAWTNVTPTIPAADKYAPKNITTIFPADSNKRYTVRVVATDAFSTSNSSMRDISASFVLQHLAKSKSSVGIGRLCDDDKTKALQVGLDAYFDKSIYADRFIYMGGYKKSDTEKDVYFQTTEGAANPHNVAIYGGNGESAAAWGVYDSKNSRSVIRYDDAAGTLRLLGFTPVGITISASGSYLKNFSGTAKHISALSMGILRVYGETNVAMPAGTTYDVASIGDHLPTSAYALSAYCLKNLDARLGSAGTIQIRPKEDIPAGYGIYIAGIWIAS